MLPSSRQRHQAHTVNATAARATWSCASRAASRPIHATSGLGKVIVDPRFSKTDKNTYQSPDYDSAANRVEITVQQRRRQRERQHQVDVGRLTSLNEYVQKVLANAPAP